MARFKGNKGGSNAAATSDAGAFAMKVKKKSFKNKKPKGVKAAFQPLRNVVVEEKGADVEDIKEEDAIEESAIIKQSDDYNDISDAENSEKAFKEENDQTENDGDDDDKKDVKSRLKGAGNAKRISNDVNEGCTVFIKNVPFDTTDLDLRKVCRKYGPVWYAIINREPISGHSKGTAFVKFKTKESADLCLQAGDEFAIDSEVMQSFPAMSREQIKEQQSGQSDEAGKDSRNLYLAREGLIMAGSKAAEGVSAADMAKRHQLEQIKTQVLKNLNRFISRNRLSIHNLPLNYDNDNLKNMIVTYTGFRPHECRVMRENKITPEHPKGKSKGFGFMSFSTHKEALIALRKLNNNPKMFGNTHRPIVAFSIEDRAVHKIKEKRAYKSRINNPTYIAKHENHLAKKRKDRVQASRSELNDSKDNIKRIPISIGKKQQQAKKTAAKENDFEQYTGTMAKPGAVMHMRSNKKIMEQSQTHKQRVKANKRKEKQQKIKQIHLAERMAADRAKPKQKFERDDLAPLISKYKSMLNNSNNSSTNASTSTKAKKPKRTKWFAE